MNEPGRCFWITGSPTAGVTAGWMASAGLPGTKVVAFGRRLSWTMWKTGSPRARAQSSACAIRVIAFGPSGSTILPIGAKYSCWASMISSAVFSMVSSPQTTTPGVPARPAGGV